MARVKDSEKNKERVERKLLVKNLFVCLDREGFATFYNDDIPIIFHSGNQKSKEKEDSKKKSDPCVAEKSLKYTACVYSHLYIIV